MASERVRFERTEAPCRNCGRDVTMRDVDRSGTCPFCLCPHQLEDVWRSRAGLAGPLAQGGVEPSPDLQARLLEAAHVQGSPLGGSPLFRLIRYFILMNILCVAFAGLVGLLAAAATGEMTDVVDAVMFEIEMWMGH